MTPITTRSYLIDINPTSYSNDVYSRQTDFAKLWFCHNISRDLERERERKNSTERERERQKYGQKQRKKRIQTHRKQKKTDTYAKRETKTDTKGEL